MSQQFDKSILGIAQAYGPYGFWLQNLTAGSNPDATWRALMVVSALRDKAFIEQGIALLKSPDSRVRAWSCYYLGTIKHLPVSDHLIALTYVDPSPRVRFHARQALAALCPGSESAADNRRRFAHCQFRVLISEDNQRGRERMSILLKRVGFETYTAETEQETVSLGIKIKPQVIVTDNQKGMDNLSGLNMTWDLCRNPDLRETILIMLTDDDLEPIFLWEGGDFFLSKRRFGGARLGPVLEMYMR